TGFYTWVHDHVERMCCRISCHCETRLILTWQYQWSRRFTFVIHSLRNFGRLFIAQIPRKYVEPGFGWDVVGGGLILFELLLRLFLLFLLAGVSANYFPRSIQNLQFDRGLRLFLQVVINDSTAQRILSDRIAPAAEAIRAGANRGSRSKKMRIARKNRSIHLTKRADVIQDPERAAMRSNR